MHIKVGYLYATNTPLLLARGDAVHIRVFLENFSKIDGEVFFIRKNVINENINNIKIYNIRWIKRNLKKLNNLLFNIRLYQAGSSIIRKEKPEIIHEREVFLSFAGLLLANKFKILIGGGSITQEWANEVGADGYGRDGPEAAEVAKRILRA